MIKRILLILLFFLGLLLLGLLSLLDEDKTVSEEEKRQLGNMPILNLNTWFDGSFANEFETYYTDTFPIRDEFLKINQNLNYFYKFTLENEESIAIIEFEEDALLVGGENLDNIESSPDKTPAPYNQETIVDSTFSSPAQTLTPIPSLEYPEKGEEVYLGSSIIIVGNRGMSIVTKNDSAITRFADSTNDIADALEGINVFCLIIPTSGEYYSPEYYHIDERSQKDMLASCYDQMQNINIVNPHEILKNHANEYIYFNTDHHWTALGAYYAYVEFCKVAEFNYIELSEYKTGRYDKFIGSFYGYTKEHPQSKKLVENPDYIDYYLSNIETKVTQYNSANFKDLKGHEIELIRTDISSSYSNKYLCFIGGDYPLVKIDTSVENARTCLLIKDSYGNAFAPYLVKQYETIFVVDPRKFNCNDYPQKFNIQDFAVENGVDDVIIINNSFMVNNYAYGGILSRMLPMSYQ